MDIFRRKQKVQQAQPVQPSQEVSVVDPLKQLCSGDEEMYEVMSHFLLLNPNKTCSVFNVENTVKEAEQKLLKGRNMAAVADFATLAMMEIYNQHREKAKEFLERVVGIPEENKMVKMSRMLLNGNNLDKALEIAKAYYPSQCESAKRG